MMTQNKVRKEVQIKILYAFSTGGKGGNPAGVVLDADDLTPIEKQRIAATVGVSETAFVSRSVHAGFKLEFFTPNKQIAHCGHATIATFSYLKRLGLISGDRSSKETIDGNRAIHFVKGTPYMEQTAPSYKDVTEELQEILDSLHLEAKDLRFHQSPSIVNTGNSFLIVPVANETILKNIVPDFEKIAYYSGKHDLIGYYVFSPSQEKQFDASTRMFAPRYAINEEAATGMAAGPLGCYLFDRSLTTKTQLIIKQGDHMTVPSPSLIRVDIHIEDDKIEKLFVGGDAYVGDEKMLQLME